MKKTFLILSCVALGLISCNKTEATTETSTSTEAVAGGQEAVVDEDSAPTIVKLAAGNKDLSTLVTAVEAAGLTTSLSNAGHIYCFCTCKCCF